MSTPKKFIQYHYDPSKPAAITLTVLFALTTLLHIYQSILLRKRLAWFMLPFILGSTLETLGYAARISSSNNPTAQTPYILQTLFILLAPALMAASIYMILGRIIKLTRGAAFALIRRNWLTGIFVLGDILSIVTQAVGGIMLTSSKGTLQEQKDRKIKGKNIILGGLFIQIVFFAFFILVCVLFQVRGKQHFKKLNPNLAWRKHMYALYAVSLLIFARSIVRVVEFAQGIDGYVYSHEVFLYVFDGALMFIAMACMNAVHPAEITELLRDGVRLEGSEMGRLDRVGV
ncbi:RTA1 like protein [Massarina eburnea CBS 473.64]|uniref:RTA1 like protein n=1 Tax=Massarina eburnea CBS 473.64 TaxID=1395130 RepID=A0A6A6RP59_9PLEO|nr:RTA1 like protein [Massarina eburnea CBS 473.64]